MHLMAALCLCQLATVSVQTPVLEFPEPGLDDPSAYEGYTTRFFRDAARNAFQIYLDARSGRVVHVWADAANASAAFTVRDTTGDPAPVRWGGTGAEAAAEGNRRAMRHRLSSELDALEVGWFVLGTMRQERDFQGWGWHLRPFGQGRFVLQELADLVDHLALLPAAEREQHLSLLNARDMETLRRRLEPTVSFSENGKSWSVLVEHTTLDGRNRQTMELRGDHRTTVATVVGDVVSLVARSPGGITFEVVTGTDAVPLTPLARDALFNDEFWEYYERKRAVADSVLSGLDRPTGVPHAQVAAYLRLERAVRGLELLSYEEKLMAALPNYATYFGRDMMMSALMLDPVVSADVLEHVIASVLEKLTPDGQVSHEEALGGQAIRENAADYSTLIRAWTRDGNRGTTSNHLAHARVLLGNLQRVRENYRMIDDDFQLSVLVDRYLSRSDVDTARKQQFLMEVGSDGRTRLAGLIRNLAFVAELSRPYVEQPTVTNLVGFQFRDDRGFHPGSWRDSRAGYGNGRFAMDVNVVWVPQSLAAARRILDTVTAFDVTSSDVGWPIPADAPTLRRYVDQPAALERALMTWRQARRHFEVRIAPEEIGRHVTQTLDSFPAAERDYWRRRLAAATRDRRALSFLALALDSLGQPIRVANTDPATDLFLGNHTEEVVQGLSSPEAVSQMLDVFERPYPIGLYVDGLGPLVANDAYARRAVQRDFRDDLYHSPHVVWGREVNLLLLGLARQIGHAYDDTGRLRQDSETMRAYVARLRRLLEATRQAVEASGMRHNELWRYRIEGEALRPVRYGSSSDIQLWNLTDLAVGFQLERLPQE